ncbi:hypothetical protein GOP47_0013443 [Adiantum capillus-veneris]|uniref:Uncharacterized protein n=1 Tax=Adiantum capillus-veneris TaxID=13818 RepID=A0A9D4UP21_ADICA|nr:hypothetical protein GOP47_0013443 [Adiantum capillus-veneris]
MGTINNTWYLGRVQKMQKKIGNKYVDYKRGLDLTTRPQGTEVQLGWYQKARNHRTSNEGKDYPFWILIVRGKHFVERQGSKNMGNTSKGNYGYKFFFHSKDMYEGYGTSTLGVDSTCSLFFDQRCRFES